MAKGDDVQERLIDFAVMVLSVCSEMPDTPAGRHISGQILRSGTSPAPNYGEARGAESIQDFVHKLRIVLKELNETAIWLKMIIRGRLLPAGQLEPLERECSALSKIINASISTVQTRHTPGKKTRQTSALLTMRGGRPVDHRPLTIDH